MKTIYSLLKETFIEFRKDNIPQMAASLAYFSLFATAPILLVSITILNFFLSGIQTKTAILNEINTTTGPQVADTVNLVLQNFQKGSHQNITAEIASLLLLLIGATTLFIQLKYTLNAIWGINSKKSSSLFETIHKRFISLIGILLAGIALFILFILGITVNILGTYTYQYTGLDPSMIQNSNAILSFLFIIGIIASVYKFVPDADIAWEDALIGATVTTILFTIGRQFLSLYFNYRIVGTIYGTAGSLLVFLGWVYYSTFIFLFGAELTNIYAKRYGKGVQPN